jgi:hypothetical protein
VQKNRRLPGIAAREVLSQSVAQEFLICLNAPINLSRVETFPGAACFTRFVAIHPPRQMSRCFSHDAKWLPSKALGDHAPSDAPHSSTMRTSTKLVTSRSRPLFFSFGKAPTLQYFWGTTVNTSSTPTASAKPSAGLFSVYFFYFWWGSNSF